MITLSEIRAVYFVGIGGIGMSAIARYFLHRGVDVAGYDRTPSDLTERLRKEGANVHYEESVSLIPAACRDRARTLVVYTPAVPATHLELAFFRAEGFEIMKRAQVLGLLTRNRAMEGRVIHDRIVYYCQNYNDIDSLQWRLGGVDAILFPNRPDGGPSGGSSLSDHPEHDGMGPVGRAVKRSFDAVSSALLLLVFSPLIGICAAAVKLEDGGRVIYAQERVGRRGVPFYIYKFRSMREDAEADGGPQLYDGDDDPRLTRVGRFLRAHHLDELPQLWNVLRGDMSLIGYRPERQFYISQIMARNPRYRYLYQIRPGVTSYATLYNGYTDTLEKMLTRLDLDLYYLRNRSVWFDVKVLGLTFLSIIVGRRF